MKFSSITKGTRAELKTALPPPDGAGEAVPCVIRALNGTEEDLALSRAREHAKAQGIADPKVGEPIYDLALMVETIAIGCLDPDSPEAAREPLFDGGAPQVRTAYGREAISFAYEQQQEWQDEVSPSIKKLDPKGYIDALFRLGGANEEDARAFFIRSGPGLRWSLLRTMALQLVTSLTARSESGSNSAAATPTSRRKAGASRKSKRR